MSDVLAWIEDYKLHIDSYFRHSDASNPHLAGTKLVNLSVPFMVLVIERSKTESISGLAKYRREFSSVA
jgi:hypothetical protein